MAKILVKLKTEIIKTLDLDISQEYFAGRGDNCAIILEAEKGISRQHIKIYYSNSKWKVLLVSKIGELFLNNESKNEIELENGLLFTVYPYDFIFEDTVLSLEPQVEQNSQAKAVQTIENLSAHEHAVAISEKTMTVAHSYNLKPIIIFLDENGNETKKIEMNKEIFVAGREADNDIVLENQRISRKQFKITNIGNKFFIQDLNSVNGTFLNGNKISPSEPVVLLSGDIISVLNIKLSFTLIDTNFEIKALEAINHLPIAPQEPLNELASWEPQFNPPSEEQLNSQPAVESFSAPANPYPILNFWGLKIELNKQNKIRIAIVGALLLIVIFLNNSNDSSNGVDDAAKASAAADPFLKLSPEEQNYVKHTYNLAKNLYMQANYQMAQAELLKLHEKIPKYEDSKDLENYVKIAIEDLKRKEENERIESEKRELEDRIQNVVKHCSQFINKDMSIEQLNECLAPALQINPEHPALISLKEQLNKIEEERKLRLQEQAQFEAQVKALKDQYDAALALTEKNQLKGIAALDEVMGSTLPDPEKLKEKAKKKKNNLMKDSENKIKEAIEKSKSMAEGENFKDAILLLEKAQTLDPEDEKIPEQIALITGELKKKMQGLYQEAIVEENIGNVETAKERWKKILELDVPAGEYFQKSKIKLKKYGAI